MLKRFLIGFTAVFAGALAVEVLDYHQIATLEKDRWALTPDISGTLLLLAALLLLAWPRRASIGLFAVSSGISIAVGLAGTAFHLASHALTPGNVGSAATWLGDPPPLAPLEFAVVGLLGLLAIAWERGATPASSQIPFVASACYGLGALSSLTALILAARTAPTAAVFAVGAALVIGFLGYMVELSAMALKRTT